MHIYLARHGQTNYNELGLCNADPSVDVHLSGVGITQAQALADKLKAAKFDKVYVSELRRTQQTAEYINEYHKAPVQVDSRLNDNRTGFEGMPVSDFYTALEAADDRWTARFNDGESLSDTKMRVMEFIDELKSQDFNDVLIVTSMSIVQAIYGLVNNLSDQQAWDFQVEKGSCIELDI
jgi:probable phosphoglycerate mutase